MTKSKVDATESIKEMLSAQIGGAANDWKRLSKKKGMWGDTEREFGNKKTSEKISVYEREDGLLYAERENGDRLTARLSADFNAAAKPAVVDQVMNLILESADEIDDALYAQAQKEGLVKNFSFAISQYDMGDDEPTTFATIYPTTRDSTFRSPSYIRPLVPALYSQDECMEDLWFFRGEETSDPAKLAEYLVKQGVTFDAEGQKRCMEVYDEVVRAVAAVSPSAEVERLQAYAAKQPLLSIETDPAKNTLADRIITMLMDEYGDLEEDDDTSFGIPVKMAAEAGKALANRYSFALESQDGAALNILTSPTRYMEEHKGYIWDRSGPIDDILPEGVSNSAESSWEMSGHEDPKDAVLVAKAMQAAGFVWSRQGQNLHDKTLTDELSAALEGEVQPTPAAKVKDSIAKSPKP